MVEAIISEILDPIKLKFLIDNYQIFLTIKYHMVEAIISEIFDHFKLKFLINNYYILLTI